MKNTLFKSSRFALVAKKYYSENGRTMLLRLVTMFGVMVTVFCIQGLIETGERNWTTDNSDTAECRQECQGRIHIYQQEIEQRSNETNGTEIGFATFMIFAFGIYISSTMVEHTDNKAGRIALYTQPASYFEKYLIRWLTVFPAFIIAFLLSFFFADIIRTAVCHGVYPSAPGTHTIFWDTLGHEILHGKNIIYLLICLYPALTSMFMLGSTVYSKNAFVKTFVSVAVLAILVIYTGYLATKFYKADEMYSQVVYVSFYSSEDFIISIISWLLCLLALINWLVTYFRFKENDVIHRLI